LAVLGVVQDEPAAPFLPSLTLCFPSQRWCEAGVYHTCVCPQLHFGLPRCKMGPCVCLGALAAVSFSLGQEMLTKSNLLVQLLHWLIHCVLQCFQHCTSVGPSGLSPSLSFAQRDRSSVGQSKCWLVVLLPLLAWDASATSTKGISCHPAAATASLRPVQHTAVAAQHAWVQQAWTLAWSS
jgi:hypothetical protein